MKEKNEGILKHINKYIKHYNNKNDSEDNSPVEKDVDDLDDDESGE